MLKKFISSLPDIINILSKGGDFMGIEQGLFRLDVIQRTISIMKDPDTQKAVSVMEWEGGISPGQEVVSDQRKDSTHPLVVGRR